MVGDGSGEVFWYDLWIGLTSNFTCHMSLVTWQMTLITCVHTENLLNTNIDELMHDFHRL